MTGKSGGSVLGGALLVAGSCIGVGMLALPILTGLAGFFPALLMFLTAWIFTTVSGLYLVEVNGWFSEKVNLLSMATLTFGRFGRTLSWVLYLFLFYALMVAYITGSGDLGSTFLGATFSAHLPIWLCSLFFVIFFGWLIYLGTRPVDLWNRFLMAGKIIAYIGMVALGVKYVMPQMLLRTEASEMFLSLPVLVIAFGYQNMIPTLVSYMNGDLKKTRKTILIGSLFVLVVYVIWEVIVLGIVPLEGPSGIKESLSMDKEASQAVAGILRSSWVGTFAQALAFFAILTSFLAQGLSLVHFLADGFKIRGKNRESGWLCALALLPPLVLSLIYPQLFFKALNFAGGICTMILFGLLPVAMVWMGRYKKQVASKYQVPGGKPLLIGVFLFSLCILFFQLSKMLT